MMNRRQLFSSAGVTLGMSWAAGAGYVLFGTNNASGLLNVSYDATRGLYRRINRAFTQHGLKQQGHTHRITPSHGGSASQARAVIDGLPADVVTLAIWPDTQQIVRAGLLDADWMNRLPNRSLPYTSTIVFLVRRGNPHGIRGWADLPQRSVRIITANPKTSGSAKLVLLAAWGVARTRWNQSPEQADAFVKQLYRQVPALDSSSRAATVTFSRKSIGDVLLTWESEAWLAVREAPNDVEIVWPEEGSILAEPHVAWVDRTVQERGSQELAQQYLEYLYHPEVKQILTEEGLRPHNPHLMYDAGQQLFQERFGRLSEPALFTLKELFPTDPWSAAQERFFAEDALFDKVYTVS
ncbi:MAG: sulfate ABC transporter substrate-binding protein [Bacteroidales bacterium]|nr:sulfate ABC transporter substrate-binding protein [Bacteroidales bacterium]